MKSSALLSLTKKIIRGAIGIGIDEAGARICGPTAWKFTKKILSPVVDELEKRFPKLFLVPEETEKAVEALSGDKALQDMLSDGFLRLESGQNEVLALLAQQNDTLRSIGISVDDGFKKADKKSDDAFANIAKKLESLELKLELLGAPGEKTPEPSPDAVQLTPKEINDQVYAYQADAIRWVVVGEADAASQRLAEGRALVESGSNRYPGDSDLLVSLGYIEKTEAQAAQIRRDHEGYVTSLEKAATCFASVLQKKPKDVGALNGMANIYYSHLDFDRAIELGTLAVKSDPKYGAAWWDLAFSYEGKIGKTGPEKPLINELQKIYSLLESLMPAQPDVFTAADFAYVQKQLQTIKTLKDK